MVLEFQAVAPGPTATICRWSLPRAIAGAAGLPRIRVEGKTIFVELNSNSRYRSTAADLLSALNNNAAAKSLVKAVTVFGPTSTDITTPAVNYSPVPLRGANTAWVRTSFNTGTNLEVLFTAVASGPEANGIQLEFTKRDRGGAADPVVQVVDQRTIRVELNSNNGNETTAAQLVEVFNANAQARRWSSPRIRSGIPERRLASRW